MHQMSTSGLYIGVHKHTHINAHIQKGTQNAPRTQEEDTIHGKERGGPNPSSQLLGASPVHFKL